MRPMLRTRTVCTEALEAVQIRFESGKHALVHS